MKSDANGSRILPLLILLLAGSGCAALIYEIVWFQLLQLVIGSSAISLGLLLAAYMGGLCLGSALLPRIVPQGLHPLRVYGVIESGIGILGLIVLFAVPLVGRMYVAAAAQGLIGLVVRGAIAAVCLLPPTVLMGASLPAIARWVRTTPKGLSWVGFLYSGNIAGAVFGCLLAGFYLLRVYDMAVATYAAAAVNLLVAAISFVAAARFPRATEHGVDEESRLLDARRSTRRWLVLVSIGLFGLCAGSGAGSVLARHAQHAWSALAGCQILLAVAIAWTGYTLSHSLPYWPIDPWLSLNPWFNFEIDLVRCVWAIFPATLLWGASFPLALAAAAAPGEDPGRLSGEIYAANTAGSVTGALLFSLVLIPTVGTRTSQQFLIGLSAVAAVAATLSVSGVPRLRAARYATIAAAIVLAAVLTPLISEVPWAVVAYGRRLAPIMRAFDFDREYPTTVLYRGEGINSSFLIAERAGQRQFFVSGKAEASTAPLDMRLERMMGHVPALIHPDPRSVLVVGFGAGVTAGSFVVYPDVENIVICELESQIPPASTKYFGTQNYNVLNDRRTRIVYDDARHYIFTTRDKFDVITTDPIHPWVKGTSTLYSKEYYELVKGRLNPGGVVAQWLPIYDSDPETIEIELATFFAVFPSGTIWSNNLNGDGYDLTLIGQADASVINVDDVQRRFDDPAYASVLQSLSEVGFHAAVELFATYAGRASDLQPLLVHAQINNDMNLRLQYIAGLGLNSMAFQGIYRTILAYRRFPDGLFTGSTGRIDALRTLLRPR